MQKNVKPGSNAGKKELLIEKIVLCGYAPSSKLGKWSRVQKL